MAARPSKHLKSIWHLVKTKRRSLDRCGGDNWPFVWPSEGWHVDSKAIWQGGTAQIILGGTLLSLGPLYFEQRDLRKKIFKIPRNFLRGLPHTEAVRENAVMGIFLLSFQSLLTPKFLCGREKLGPYFSFGNDTGRSVHQRRGRFKFFEDWRVRPPPTLPIIRNT